MELIDDVILAKSDGTELGVFSGDFDFEIGENNDFEIYPTKSEWDAEKFAIGNFVYIPDTEYGGIIDGISNSTSKNEVTIHGVTWRGLLDKKFPYTTIGYVADFVDITKKANDILKLCDLNMLFYVENKELGIDAKKWEESLLSSALENLDKLTRDFNCKMHISLKRFNQKFKIEILLSKRENLPDAVEFSEDNLGINMTVEDNAGGINHLICAGEGQGGQRIRKDLYVQKDGSIGTTPYYKGLDERTELYSYTSADEEELERGGRKRLAERQSYKKSTIDSVEGEYDVSDIVTGYDQLTETSVSEEINRKVLKRTNGILKLEYSTKGEK